VDETRSHQRRWRRVLLAAVLLLVLAGAGVAWYLGPIAPIATGYAAKTVCSGVFVADRDRDDVAGDLPDNPLVPLLRTSVDHDEASVSTSLLGAWGSTAYSSEGLGCTLADERPLDTDPAIFAAPDRAPAPDPDVPWPEGNAPSTPGEQVDTALLDAALELAFVEDDPDGRQRNTRAVVVVKDGELIAERYGEGFGPDTPLLGWSMAKSVASAMIGRLVHEGVLDLDDAGLRPEWSDDARSSITLEQLLTMTSGLAFEEVYDPDTDATRMLFLPQDTGAYAAARPLEHLPGTVWNYSSGTTNILCDVAQDATGSGPELANDLIFAPLGMSSAVMEPDASGGLICSSFLYATARDWARFGQFALQDGVWEGERLLPENFMDAATRPVDVDTEGTPYGYQWWLNEGSDGALRMPSVPADAYWASGNEGQQVVVIPSEDLVVVRLGFSGAFGGIEWGLEPMLATIVEATG
jgi:CubicO group peptidase (beta-lactamase class C family)